jgi:hypothetical protein
MENILPEPAGKQCIRRDVHNGQRLLLQWYQLRDCMFLRPRAGDQERHVRRPRIHQECNLCVRCLHLSVWLPQSGNPGGRPRVIGELRDLARQHAPEAIEELARLALKAKNESARIAAIKELLDRGYGKPLQSIEAAGKDGGPIETRG